MQADHSQKGPADEFMEILPDTERSSRHRGGHEREERNHGHSAKRIVAECCIESSMEKARDVIAYS
jgi:hypothetical protein